jgi:hypothetical protein
VQHSAARLSLPAMRRFAPIAVLFLASAYPTTAAFAQTPPGMTLHRVQAGEPDASGWMVAASTQGGFSVRLPLKFNDFTIQEANSAAAVLRLHTVGAKSQEGIKFSATRLVYRDGAEAAGRSFSRFESGADFRPKPQRITPGSFGGHRSVDLVLGNGSSVSYQRAVLVDSDLVLMVIESPRQFDETARGFVKPFFDSLVVR